MISFPPAKINIGLNILGKRPDGYHNLETVFFAIPWCDVLEIIPYGEPGTIDFSASGLALPLGDENICKKAYNLVASLSPALPGVKMHLHKNIPIGAGLGGGSSDAAGVLNMLDGIFNLGFDKPGLVKMSAALGSDCPFFIDAKPTFATGRGEILEDVNLHLSGYHTAVIFPGIHISTAEAFSSPFQEKQFSTSLEEYILQDPVSWKDNIINDFEKPVFTKHPELKIIKNLLYNQGAIYASLSGSGSALYGVFNSPAEELAGLLPGCRVEWFSI